MQILLKNTSKIYAPLSLLREHIIYFQRVMCSNASTLKKYLKIFMKKLIKIRVKSSCHSINMQNFRFNKCLYKA
jgi:hypothetical protein